MTIDLKTVKHISKLARISVNDEKAKEDWDWKVEYGIDQTLKEAFK